MFVKFYIIFSESDEIALQQFEPLLKNIFGNEAVLINRQQPFPGFSAPHYTVIQKCDLVVCLVSNTSVKDRRTKVELRDAISLDKPILPVVIEELFPPYPAGIDSDLEIELRDIPFVDMSTGINQPRSSLNLYNVLNELLYHSSFTLPTNPENNIEMSVEGDIDLSLTHHSSPKNRDRTVIGALIGVVGMLIAAVITGVFGLWQGALANQNQVDFVPTFVTKTEVIPTEPDNNSIGIETPISSPEIQYSQEPTIAVQYLDCRFQVSFEEIMYIYDMPDRYDGTIIGSIPYRSEHQVIDKSPFYFPDYYLIEYESVTGWVSISSLIKTVGEEC